MRVWKDRRKRMGVKGRICLGLGLKFNSNARKCYELIVDISPALMKTMLKGIGLATLAVLLLILLVTTSYAIEMNTFNVDTGHEEIFMFNLHAGTNIEGSISITGGSGNDVDFWVTDPAGNRILDFGRVSQGTQFEFAAKEDGAYNLHFDNSFSILSTKNIVVTYEITIADLNATQVFLLLLLVAVVIVVGIVVIMKKGKKKNICSTTNPKTC